MLEAIFSEVKGELIKQLGDKFEMDGAQIDQVSMKQKRVCSGA